MKNHWLRWAVLTALVTIGLFLAWWRPLAAGTVAGFADDLVHRPAGIAGVIAVQALMFALALPGSLLLWAVAPFHGWMAATAILMAGSSLGALGGYGVAAWLGTEWRQRLQSSPPFRLLARDGGFLAQCSLRALPGFPHAAINYGGGLLGLPLPTFTVAAVVGMGLKWTVYTRAVEAMVSVGTAGDLLRPQTVVPLVALAALLVLGAAAQVRWGRQR